MAYELLAQSRKLSKRAGPNKSGGGGWKGSENFLIKISGGTLIRDPRVCNYWHKTYMHPVDNLFHRTRMFLLSYFFELVMQIKQVCIYVLQLPQLRYFVEFTCTIPI